jgi:hypothetical protein
VVTAPSVRSGVCCKKESAMFSNRYEIIREQVAELSGARAGPLDSLRPLVASDFATFFWSEGFFHGVEVYALGVDGAGKDMRYWQTLRDFWTAYFERTGGSSKPTPSSATRLISVRKYVAGQCVYVARCFFSRGRGGTRSGGRRRAARRDGISS